MRQEIPENHTRVMYDGLFAYFMELCTNPIYYDKLLFYGLVSEDSVKKARAIIKKPNATDGELKINLFQVGYEVGGNLMNRYWRPKPQIMNAIENLQREEFDDSFVIGIQIRTFFINVTEDMPKYFECALKIENDYYKECKLNKKPAKRVKWYLAVDFPSEINEFIKSQRYANKIIHGIKVIPREIYHGITEALWDVEMLSRCDQLICTGGSTYGFLSAMKNRHFRFPYFINGRLGMKECEIFTFAKPPTNADRYETF